MAVLSFTVTEIEQVELAGILPPLSLTLVLPTAKAAPADVVSVPPQALVVVVFARLICAGLAGNVSVKLTPIRAKLGLVFTRLNVSVEVPVSKMGLGLKFLLRLGGDNAVRTAILALPLPAELPRTPVVLV